MARAPFGAECGKTSNLQLYRVSTFGRDGPGKKSRTNSHTLAEWPQSVCVTSWCIDLCGPMQRARVFSSLLYQDVMVLMFFLKKTLHNPCKKPSPHKARRTPHGDLSPCRLRSSARASARVHGRTIPWASAAAPAARPRLRLPVSCSCRLVRRRRCSPGPVSTDTSSCVWWVGAVTVHLRDVLVTTDTARVFAPQGRSMAAGAAGGRQVWACITTLSAEVRTEL